MGNGIFSFRITVYAGVLSKVKDLETRFPIDGPIRYLYVKTTTVRLFWRGRTPRVIFQSDFYPHSSSSPFTRPADKQLVVVEH